MKFNFKKNWYYLIPVAIGGYLIYRQFSKKNDPKADAPNPNPLVNNVVVPIPTSDFPLKRGSKNNTVGSLQALLNTALKSQGKELLVVDNDFGPKTEIALNSIYGKNSVANQTDFDALKNQLSKSNEDSANISWGWKLQDAYNSNSYSYLFVKKPVNIKKVSKNFQGFWVNTGTSLDMARHNYSLNDYAVRGVTKSGQLRIEILNGATAGMYLSEEGTNLQQTFDIIN